MVLLVVMYECKSWTLKKAEHQGIDAFELWCWRRLLRVPWTARRSNQSVLKEISPEYSLEGLMPRLKLQYFGHLIEELTHWKRPWCWERLKAGGEGDKRGWDVWMASLTQLTWVWANSGRWWWTGKPGMLQSMGSQRVGHYWLTELNWTLQSALQTWGSTSIDLSNYRPFSTAVHSYQKKSVYKCIPVVETHVVRGSTESGEFFQNYFGRNSIFYSISWVLPTLFTWHHCNLKSNSLFCDTFCPVVLHLPFAGLLWPDISPVWD